MTTPSLPLNIYLFFILKIFSIKNQIKKEEGGGGHGIPVVTVATCATP